MIYYRIHGATYCIYDNYLPGVGNLIVAWLCSRVCHHLSKRVDKKAPVAFNIVCGKRFIVAFLCNDLFDIIVDYRMAAKKFLVVSAETHLLFSFSDFIGAFK